MIENHVHTTPTCKNSTCKNFHTGRIALPYQPLISILFYVPCAIKFLPKFSPIRAWASIEEKRGHMKAYEKKIWTHEGPWKKNLAMPKIWREGQNHRTPYSLALHSIHHISIHVHFSIMIVWLAYSLGPIFNFVKYLRQVCLSFSPTLSSTKKRTKGLGEDTNTFEWMRVSSEELVFISENFWKPSDIILSKEWVSGALWIVLSLNRPRQGEGQKPHGD